MLRESVVFQHAPLYSTFFLWGLGTGAQQLARPLFAYSFGVSIFFITLIESMNAIARLVSAPLTGYLTDRWGRKPLLLFGNGLRGVVTLGEFFVTSYEQFLVLEFIAGIGVSVWVTSSSVLLADVTNRENRGRLVAARQLSSRLGTVGGPVLAGLLAASFGLRWIFIFNAATKLIIMVITLLVVKESKPEVKANPTSKGKLNGLDLAFFRKKTFLSLAFATFAISMMVVGVFQAIFPVYVKEEVGLGPSAIGGLISIGGVATLLISYPNGVLSDRFGRKAALIPGLVLLSTAAFLLAATGGYGGAMAVVIVFGMGTGMSMGASQTIAMDMAPEDRRGTFLGIWSVFTNLGGFIAPFAVGLVATAWGFAPAFGLVGTVILIAAVSVWALSRETKAGAAPE
jgi:MFS family permease